MKLDVAKRLARQYGLAIFPLIPGQKLPALKGWQDAATTDAEKLAAWFDGTRDYNIGVATGPSGLIVLDTDQKEGRDGDANLRALAGKHVGDLDQTFTVESPTGSRHYYFSGAPVRDSVGKLADAVDVRSKGGLVVGPGSTTTKGTYRVINQAKIAPAPQWLIDAIAHAYVQAEKVELVAAVELDTEPAFAQAHAYLAEAPAAISGQGGNDTTYRVAARLKDIGLSELMAGTLMLGDWNDRCSPPWAEDELLEIVSHAYQYGENSPGSASVELDFDPIDDEDVADIGEPEAPRITGHLEFPADYMGAAPSQRPYIIKGVLAREDFACIYGEPGAGKSLIAPYLGRRIAAGEAAFGRRTRAGGVLYIPAEDPAGMRQRATALQSIHGVAPDLVLYTGVTNLRDKAQRQAVAAAIAKVRPTVIIIDTMARAFPGIDENTTEGMSEVVTTCRAMTKGGAAVILIHHNTKSGGETPRGSGLLNGDLDVAIMVQKGEDGIVRGKLTKNRNGGYEWEPTFRIAVQKLGVDEDGDPITAAYAEEVQETKRERSKLSASVRGALDIFMSLDSEGAGVTRAAWRAKCIDRPSAVSPAADRRSRDKAFDRAVGELIRAGRIVAVDIGDQAGFTQAGADGDFEDLGNDPFDQT